MSIALYPTGGLRFWSQEEIDFREMATGALTRSLQSVLKKLNPAWEFQRVEGPILTPRQFVNSSYDHDDVFYLDKAHDLNDEALLLRPETTASSYLMAKALLNPHNKPRTRLPLCVWQAGKSFRVEKADGASPAKLRFNEFWQLEYQCLYAADSKADYRHVAEQSTLKMIEFLTMKGGRLFQSDRLPSYSTKTTDVEIMYDGKMKEMCSISDRTDYDEGIACLEVAVGLDRLVEAWNRRDEVVKPGHY